MAKKIVCLGLLVLLIACTNAFAGGSGNAILPLKSTTDYRGIGAGFGCNYVGSRLMDLYNYGNAEENVVADKVSQAYGIIPIGINDDTNMFLKIGACDYELEFEDTETETDEIVYVDLDTGVYVGLGMNKQMPWEKEIGNFILGWGYAIQGNGYINDVAGVTRGGESATSQDGTFYALDGEESIFLTCRHDMENIGTILIPYIGVYHSWMIVGQLEELEYKRSSKNTEENNAIQGAFDVLSFGLLLGMDVDIAKYVNLNIEGRFIGETAVTTGATIKF